MAMNFFDQIVTFFKEDIWKIPSVPGKPFRNFFIEASRVLVASIRGFNTDECYLKASSLTFYTLLSIVPVLAVAFGVAKGFGFQEKLEQELRVQFQEQPEIAQNLIQFANKFLATTQGSVIAGVGIVVLFWTVFRLLGIIEDSLNDIWKVPQGRTWLRKLTDYLTTMLLCPFFVAISGSFTIYVTTQLMRTAKTVGYYDIASPFISFIFYALPYVFAWLLFAFIYMFIPNTKVSWRAALVAGILAGTAYQILQLFYIRFQIGVSSYGAIYGSFAALPLFLIWLNMSWIIVLAGAEVAYHSEYDFQGEALSGTQGAQRLLITEKVLGVMLCKECLENYKNGMPPLSLNELAQKIGLNIKILREVAEDLMSCHVLSRTISESHDEIYLPALKTQDITIKVVCDALDGQKEKRYFVHNNKQVSEAVKLLEDYNSEASKLSSNHLL